MSPYRPGGIIFGYQKYDPTSFPSPTAEPPDLVSPAFEHALMYGSYRELTEEELANAIRLDPSQIAGLGPSLDMLREMLEERKRKILATYETRAAEKRARKAFHKSIKNIEAPKAFAKFIDKAIRSEQPYLLERVWYQLGDDASPAAQSLLAAMQTISNKHQIEVLISKYEFTGSEGMSVP